MNSSDAVSVILKNKTWQPQKNAVKCFAPANVALAKYWGKRDKELNLPINSSLSVSLGDRGSFAELSIIDAEHDEIALADHTLPVEHPFAQRVIKFLNLFRGNQHYHFKLNATSNIPIAAGLASSASGFAVLIKALDELFAWKLDKKSLSILARLGSGSASRSLDNGFVLWHAGQQADGMDSYAEKLASNWSEFRAGILILDDHEKSVSSRLAMQRTINTSPLYSAWPQIAEKSLKNLERAIQDRHFDLLGQTAESNALAMHACMMAAQPPIMYFQPATISAMKQVWKAREEGLPVYFTQDAGPNLKLLFLESSVESVQDLFPGIDIVKPFGQ